MLPPPSGAPRDETPPTPFVGDPRAWSPAPAPSVFPAAPLPPLRKPFRLRVWPFLLGAMALAVTVGVGAFAASWTLADIQYYEDANVAWAEPLPAEVAAIARATGMSQTGELIYRASTPAVENDAAFNQHCSIEGGAVLGCYYQGNIYVYAVTDERLAGTVEVTAAHEMLHAAYERLTPAERAQVDLLVKQEISRIPDDDPVYDDLALYPDWQLDDEWHSRLGTEFADLSPALEAHYARYFDDRAKVIELNVQANAAFRELQAQIDALVTEIDALDPILDARISAYEAALAAYNADVASFNRRAENGSFSSQEQFNRERNALLARQSALNAEYDAIEAQIAYYNGLVEQLTALDADYAELYSALDSTHGQNSVDP